MNDKLSLSHTLISTMNIAGFSLTAKINVQSKYVEKYGTIYPQALRRLIKNTANILSRFMVHGREFACIMSGV